MFQFPAFPAQSYVFTMGCSGMTPNAFPHLRNPRINACLTASRGLSQLCHVFHRLLTPKHPPCTLSYLVYLLRSILDYTSRLIFNDHFSICNPLVVRHRDGGGDGARTHDLRVANAMLFQLSYTPMRDGEPVGGPKRI
jgi:hypothetical protein